MSSATETPTILNRTLGNGLGVILRESHDAPVASFWVWYRVGSRHELPGLTGLSHWVEHMQFKGTASLGKGEIFSEVSRNGGMNNAMTSNDWTAYYETLPADRVELAIRIEADRMSNSLFDAAETESERTVILSERQGAENNPGYLLYEEVIGTAFRAHPYRHMVIGHESDLRQISRDDLYSHYRRHYRPGNAFIVATGDFDSETLFATIEQTFGGIEAGVAPTPPAAIEPPQLGERRVTLRRPSPTSYLRVGYRSPAGNHPDMPALMVADAILSGGKPMGLGGAGGMGRSSRLYRSLVAAGLARSASSDVDFYVDPYLIGFAVTALPGADPDRIEAVLDEEVAKLAATPAADDEFARAVKQLKAQYVYSGEGVTNQAFWLGQMEIIDSYVRSFDLLDRIAAVTPEDVQRVAATYLRADQRSIGWLHPEGSGGGGGAEAADRPAAAYRAWGIRGPGAPTQPRAAGRLPFERSEFGNGIVVLGQAQPEDAAVSIRFRLPVGSVLDPAGAAGIAAFTGRLLLRGDATVPTAEALNEEIDNRGASISVEAGRIATDVTVRCLREDLPAMLDIAASAIRTPTFPNEEVEKVRREILTQIGEQENDTRQSADRLLRAGLFPEGHPHRGRILGDASSVSAITRDAIVEFHRQRYGPNGMTIAAVGGFERFDELVGQIATRITDWRTSEATAMKAVPAPAPLASRVREEIEIAGKSQADVAIGAVTISRTHPDYYALEMANLILGRLGLMGRLGANVRDRQGLAYYAFSSIEPGRDFSLWVSRAGVDPGNIDRAIDGVLGELSRIRDVVVDDNEIADAKSFLTGVLPLALESNDGIAGTLLSIELYGLGLDYLDRYPGIITALTKQDVQTAIGRWLDPDALAIGVARPA